MDNDLVQPAREDIFSPETKLQYQRTHRTAR
jgi:hypothetical protein